MRSTTKQANTKQRLTQQAGFRFGVCVAVPSCFVLTSGTLIDVLVLIIVTIISGTMVFNAYVILGQRLVPATLGWTRHAAASRKVAP